MEEDLEELTVSQAAAEFHIKRSTINNWLYRGIIPSRKEFGELGIEYRLVKRGDIASFLQARSKRGRPLKRTV